MDDHIPDDFDVIDEGDIQSPLSIMGAPSKKTHLYNLTSIESFLKQLQRLIAEGKSLEDITVTVNHQKRSIDSLLLDTGSITADNIMTHLNDHNRESSNFLCQNFQKPSDRRRHIRDKTPYIVFFTPKQEPKTRENKKGIIEGSIPHCNTVQRLLFTCDPHNVKQSISPDRIPKSCFAVLATPSITLSENNEVLFMNWHVQSTLALDLSGISPDILKCLPSKLNRICHIKQYDL